MRKLLLLLTLVALFFFVLIMTSGSFLVINNPQPADVIVVLAGETNHRPARGLELLNAGYAPRLMLDVPVDAKIFDIETLDIARVYVSKLPQRQAITICPIVGLSTKTEAHDVAGCLSSSQASRVLVVTSDFHTRRANSTFAQQFPSRQVFVAAAGDPTQFGTPWWKRRQWAKINFDEWLKLVWWEVVDRWR